MRDPVVEAMLVSLRAEPVADPRVAALVERLTDAQQRDAGVVDFVVNVSHELRTPLNAIIGYAELLEEELAERDEGLLPDVRRVRTAGSHVLALVNDLLDLSKLQAGRLALEPEELRVRDVVDDVAATMEQQVAEHGNRFEIEVAADAGSVLADPLRLRQCLLNLVSNANKFTEDGSVRLCVHRAPPGIRFEVSDTGIGMSAEEVGRLFRRFEQARSDTAKRFGGTGLGLALTRELVERMQGRLEVESAPGVGTSFRLFLPSAAPA